MKPEDEIRNLINNSDVTTGPETDKNVLGDALKHLEKFKKRQLAPSQSNMWRIIMKSPITRIAAAAVIIIGLGMTVYLIDKSTTPAWAIDQSIEAMKNYRVIYFSGRISMSWGDSFRGLGVQKLLELPESQGEFEMWAQADEGLSRSSKVKMVLPDNTVILGRKLQSYIKLAEGNTYDVQGDLMKIDPWPTYELLRILKEDTDSWTELYGRDAATGKDRIFVEYASSTENRFWKFEFDSESKLLVSLKQWEDRNNHEGSPIFDIRKIVYFEQLPDEIFEIDLPDSSKIISVNTPLHDPNYGMSAEGLTQEQACRKILTEFWQKVREQDFDGIRKLFPYSASWSDEVMRSNLGYDQGSVKLLEIGQIYEGKIGPVAPCTVQLKNERMVIDMIVMFREIDDKSSCVVHSNEGKPRPVE